MNRIIGIVLVLFAFGCGGVDDSTQVQVPEETPVPEQIPDFERPEAILPPDSHTCYKTGESELIDFVDNVLDGNAVSRWTRAPVVRIVEGADDRQKLVVEKAVELLNVSLPDSRTIIIAADQVPSSGDKYDVFDVPDGQIWFEFVGETCSGHISGGRIHTIYTHVRRPDGTFEEIVWTPPKITKPCDRGEKRDAVYQEMEERCNSEQTPGGCASSRFRDGALVASLVLMRGLDETCYDNLLITMVHELLHALGISGHIDIFGFRSVLRPSLLNNCRFEIPLIDWWLFIERGEVIEMDVMYPIDRDTLKAIYSLENGDYANELQIEESQTCE